MRFLIVEDEPVSRMNLAHLLKPYAQCDEAVNGDEAVQAFQRAHAESRPYDLVLLDIMMPVKDGQQALKEIREHERSLNIGPGNEVRVIILSALGDPKNVVDAYCEGSADSYLVKPYDIKVLLEVIRNSGLHIPEKA